MDKRQDNLRKNQPHEKEEDYPFAEGVGDTSFDLLALGEALEKKKDGYDLLKDLPLVKAMIS